MNYTSFFTRFHRGGYELPKNLDLSASTGTCPPRPCTLGSVPSDSPRVGVDAPEDDALPELANEAPILYTKHDVVSLIACTLTRNKINAPAVAHGP